MKSLSKKEFELIHKTGKPYYTKQIKAKILPAATTKWGFIVSGKHGGAVKRNRVRRVLKAAALNVEKKLSTGALIVILPSVGISGFYEIMDEIDSIVKRAKLVG